MIQIALQRLAWPRQQGPHLSEAACRAAVDGGGAIRRWRPRVPRPREERGERPLLPEEVPAEQMPGSKPFQQMLGQMHRKDNNKLLCHRKADMT